MSERTPGAGLLFVLCAFLFSQKLLAAPDCLQEPALSALDQRYEDALKVSDWKSLSSLLAGDFIWVHNQATLIETKPELLARLKKQPENFHDRRVESLSFHRLDKVVVISGDSVVERVNPDGASTRAARYRFMRTYVARNNQCYLLAVQTMKIWDSEVAREQTLSSP